MMGGDPLQTKNVSLENTTIDKVITDEDTINRLKEANQTDGINDLLNTIPCVSDFLSLVSASPISAGQAVVEKLTATCSDYIKTKNNVRIVH